MNYIQNDKGDMVIAEGAPASQVRVRVQYPRLIEHLRANGDLTYALAECRRQGITSPYEAGSILHVAGFRCFENNPPCPMI